MNRLAPLAAVALLAQIAPAQTYTLSGSAVVSGGAVAEGTSYSCTGVIALARTDRIEGSTYTLTGGILSRLDELGCNTADVAPPVDVLDLADVDAFIAAFFVGGSVADLAAPFGVIDLSDINEFIVAFLAGCP